MKRHERRSSTRNQKVFPFKGRTDQARWELCDGNRVIVPAALRSYMLKKVHSSHIGVERCLQKTRDVLYWPGMSVEIKDSISNCDPCNTYQKNQQKEPLIPHDPPKRAWSHVATDLLTFDEKEWSIIVDYWSDYLELNQLPDSQSKYCYQVPQEPVCPPRHTRYTL